MWRAKVQLKWQNHVIVYVCFETLNYNGMVQESNVSCIEVNGETKNQQRALTKSQFPGYESRKLFYVFLL